MLNALQYIGASLGVLGAFLLALNIKASSYAWIIWVLSNLTLLAWSFASGLWGIFGMQVVFLMTSLLGCYRHQKTILGQV